MSQERPLVLVSLVSTNDATHLVNCIRCLAASSYGSFAIFINENGGDAAFGRTCDALRMCDHLAELHVDGRAEFRLKSGDQRIVVVNAGRNLGYAGGTNAALTQRFITDWDAVWVLNPDTFPDPRAMQALVERQAVGGYGVVGSRLIFTASERIQTWGGLTWNRWLGRGRYLGYLHQPDETPDVADIERRMTFVSGASMYVTRAYIETVGGMDDDFFVYCEDLDWCLRRGHFRLGYAHDSIVRHIHGATGGASRVRAERSAFSIYLSERNKILLARKHLGAAAPLSFIVGLASVAEQFVRTRSSRQLKTALRGWLAGVRGETGFQVRL